MTPLAIPAGLVVNKVVAGLLSALLATGVGLPARDEIRAQQWHLEFLNIEQAHAISTGEGVIVGVVDTGVDGGHPDLAGSLLPGTDFSVLRRPDALEDLDGHGTVMAGVIAAHGRTLGVAPDATILPVRREAFNGTGFADTAAMAIEYAVDNGATVLCLAFAYETLDPYMQEALDYALANDVVVVAGVGNAPMQYPRYPSAYPGVVGVAGVGRDGNHAEFSVVGPSATVAAPAVEIASAGSRTVSSTGFWFSSGTSNATAIVAGVAALVRAEFPELSAADVINRMTATADDRGVPGRDDEYGYGIVNPVAALTADIPPLEPSETSIPEPTRSDASPPGDSSGVPVWMVVAGAGIVVLLIAGLVVGLRRT